MDYFLFIRTSIYVVNHHVHWKNGHLWTVRCHSLPLGSPSRTKWDAGKNQQFVNKSYYSECFKSLFTTIISYIKVVHLSTNCKLTISTGLAGTVLDIHLWSQVFLKALVLDLLFGLSRVSKKYINRFKSSIPHI